MSDEREATRSDAEDVPTLEQDEGAEASGPAWDESHERLMFGALPDAHGTAGRRLA